MSEPVFAGLFAVAIFGVVLALPPLLSHLLDGAGKLAWIIFYAVCAACVFGAVYSAMLELPHS